MRRKHAAEVGFSLEENIRLLVFPLVQFVIYLVHYYHTFIPSPYAAAKLLSHLFIIIFLFCYTFFLYSCSYNKKFFVVRQTRSAIHCELPACSVVEYLFPPTSNMNSISYSPNPSGHTPSTPSKALPLQTSEQIVACTIDTIAEFLMHAKMVDSQHHFLSFLPAFTESRVLLDIL